VASGLASGRWLVIRDPGGATDEFGFAAVENRVHVHDLHATLLHLLGFDHTRLTYRYAGRDFRLTDVHGSAMRREFCEGRVLAPRRSRLGVRTGVA
jgi:hypothetical protein